MKCLVETRNRQHTRQLLLSLRRQYPRGLVRMEGMDEEDARELGLTGGEDEVIFYYSSQLNTVALDIQLHFVQRTRRRAMRRRRRNPSQSRRTRGGSIDYTWRQNHHLEFRLTLFPLSGSLAASPPLPCRTWTRRKPRELLALLARRRRNHRTRRATAD